MLGLILAMQRTDKSNGFAEANLALPNLDINNTSVDDLFDALVLQRDRLREMQQLQEW